MEARWQCSPASRCVRTPRGWRKEGQGLKAGAWLDLRSSGAAQVGGCACLSRSRCDTGNTSSPDWLDHNPGRSRMPTRVTGLRAYAATAALAVVLSMPLSAASAASSALANIHIDNFGSVSDTYYRGAQ